jgi:AraC-like DNA-binding protein
MVAGLKRLSLKNLKAEQINLIIHNHIKSIVKTINKFKGSIVKQKADYFLTSFDSVTNAVQCALEIQEVFRGSIGKMYSSDINLNIGLSAGIPVTERAGIFEDTIKLAERLCDVVKSQITVSSEVKDLYESENLNISIDNKLMGVLNLNDEKFLNLLMDYTEREWNNTTSSVDTISKSLGYSKSQLYRKIISITGKSPNSFIKDYRLNKALQLLNKNIKNISQVAFETGFNSPAYFSKCFLETFGVLPSNYIKSGLA